MTKEKILEIEELLQSLSDEMLKLKSSSEQYSETKEHLQKICKTLEKIQTNHEKIADDMNQFLAEMDKIKLEGEKTRELVSSIYNKASDLFKTELHENNEEIKGLVSTKINEINNELTVQNKEILSEIANRSKSMGLLKYLIVLGVAMEAVIIILLILTSVL